MSKLTKERALFGLRGALWALPLVVFSVGAWARRWMDDDGFINLRIVRNILHGHGPVFNLGDRVEAGTSPLWLFILTLLGGLHIPLEGAAVYSGIVLAIGGLALAMWGAHRLTRAPGQDPEPGWEGVAWPIGASIYAVLPAAWDYASSGLDTGLGLFWFGACYATLARLVRRPEAHASTRRTYLAAALFGLGPLIRPEFAIYALVWLVLLLLDARRKEETRGSSAEPSRTSRSVAWVAWVARVGACAGAAPLAYELFRLGYYGATTPNTAIAKEAFRTNWSQGACYFHNFFFVYAIGFPGSAAAVFFLARLRTLRENRDRLGLFVATLPPLAGALHILYVVAIGGDYMHARMFLAPFLSMALPIFVMRVGAQPNRLAYAIISAAGVLSCWLVMCAVKLRCPAENECYIGDERRWYAEQASVRAPIDLATYRGHPFYEDGQKALAAIEAKCPKIAATDTPHEGDCDLLYFNEKEFEPIAPTAPTFPLGGKLDPRIGAAVGYGAIGIFGYMMPDSVHVIDRHGLAETLGSHLELPIRGRPGHEKTLLSPWLVARYAAAMAPEDAAVTAARHALDCGALKSLTEGPRVPLTTGQFFRNIAHAFEFSRMRIPLDPFAAETLYCHTPELPQFSTGTDGGLAFRWQCPAGYFLSGVRFAIADKGGAIERISPTCEPEGGSGAQKGPLQGPVFGGAIDQPLPHEVHCPRGNITVGIFGARGGLVQALGMLCAPSTAQGVPSHGSARGRMDGTPFSLACPAGTRLLGLEGRAGDLVDHAGIVCTLPSSP